MKLKQLLYILMLLSLTVLAACSVERDVMPEDTDPNVVIPVESDVSVQTGSKCPEAIVGTSLFTNLDDGFCLLLPDGYAVDDSLVSDNGGGETAVYVDSLQGSNAHPRLFITVEAANGRSLDEITSDKAADIDAGTGTATAWSLVKKVGGVPAKQFVQVPGQDISRQVLLVANDLLYTFIFTPDDEKNGDAYDEMQILYDTVMGSFSFQR